MSATINPMPATMSALHELLSHFVSEGYEPMPKAHPVAVLHVAGKVWHIDRDWFIETTGAPRGATDWADCTLVKDEMKSRCQLTNAATSP